MGSRQQGSNNFSTVNQNEVKKRSWTSAEEEVVLSALKKLVAEGWKSDNGFRGGYMLHLEAAMKKAFPQTDLKGKPHIESKLTAWKRTYATLRDILARSGVGFNVYGDNKIDCDNVVWEEICKSDPGISKSWRNKEWPYLETWKIVFGKDRANGEGAAEFIHMVNEVLEKDEVPTTKTHKNHVEPDATGLQGDKPTHTSVPEDSVGQSTYEVSKPSKNPKKRQFEESISSLVDLVADIQKTNAAKYAVFNSAFGKKPTTNKERRDLWTILQSIEGFTLEEMFDVGEKLLQMPARLEIFLGLSEDARPAYIHRSRKLDP